MWCLDTAACTRPEFSNGRSTVTKYSSADDLPHDVDAALETLTRELNSGHELLAACIDRTQPLVAGRAPARLDVMGGIADYSGSTVLQLPLKESTVALCQRSTDHEFKVISMSEEEGVDVQTVSIPLADFFDRSGDRICSELAMQSYFASLADEHQWVAYVAGVLTVLMLHCDLRPQHGIVLMIQSTVPVGKGVSSSAALEVATMRALCGLLGVSISAHRQAVLCQRVENLIVGAPCGLMDQMASSCGQQGALLNMLCQPDIVNEPVSLPDELSVWGIDSGIRHAVSGADYGSVRVAAFMGYRYLLEISGVAARHVLASEIDDQRWHGYLANMQVAEFMQKFYSHLPERVTGEEFLARFDATTDPVTRVDADRQYAVRACTAHPVHEHFRVRLFYQLADSARQTTKIEALATLMGECMYQSHAGYTSCGLDCAECDELVARLSALGAVNGIYGARITGGGSGGAVAVLAKRSAEEAILSVAAEYAASTGAGGYVFAGSSDGASAHPLLPLPVHRNF